MNTPPAIDGLARLWHELKTDPDVFDAVAEGRKTCEIRYDDRDFKVGDGLLLRRTKWNGADMKKNDALWPLVYTGQSVRRVVSHVLRGYGLEPGWVILSFAPAELVIAQQQSPGTGGVTAWEAIAPVVGQEPPAGWQINLDEADVAALLGVIGGDGEPPAIALSVGAGHAGHGLYAWLEDYPDEGAQLIKALPLSGGDVAPAPSGEWLKEAERLISDYGSAVAQMENAITTLGIDAASRREDAARAALLAHLGKRVADKEGGQA